MLPKGVVLTADTIILYTTVSLRHRLHCHHHLVSTRSQHLLDLVCFVNKHDLYLSLIETASSLFDVRKYYINEQAVTVNVSALKKNTLLFRSMKNNI